NDRKICGRQLVSLSAGGRLSGASFSRMEAKGEQILAGSYRRLCLSLSLSGYGRDHYKIFHWPVCILADDVAASDGGDVRLRGSVFPWLIPEAVASKCVRGRSGGGDHCRRDLHVFSGKLFCGG